MSDAHISKKTYWTVFAILMVLLFLTVFVAYMHIDPTLGIIVAMLIATIKAVLVVLYFMHVKINSKLTQLCVATGFIFLIILIGITLTDYKTRSWDRVGYQNEVDAYSSPFDVPVSTLPQNQPGAAAADGDETGGDPEPDADH